LEEKQSLHIENSLAEHLDLASLEEESYLLCKEFIEKAKLKKGQLFVVGCSTSEVLGEKIGTASSYSTAEALFRGISRAAKEAELYLCTQCCEHLNRAIITEREAALAHGLMPYRVNVIPKEKAGGSFSTVAYESFREPVALEKVRADGGIDIGDTFIGMHLKEVAVPLRLSKKTLGSAHITAARVRPKFVGGSRAVYDESLL
jgi:TIGR01440 family protein